MKINNEYVRTKRTEVKSDQRRLLRVCSVYWVLQVMLPSVCSSIVDVSLSYI
jgi:hypothetical protein